MPVNMASDEMAALLKILDTVEHTIDEGPISNIQKLTELPDDAKPELGNAATPDRNTNRFVERIAAAMMKLRVQGA
jgi:hypothetical protein